MAFATEPASKNDPSCSSPPRIVILGGGYGGVYTALGLQKAARNGLIHLSIISRENFFLAQPMLAEVVSGSIEPPHIISPIRRLCPKSNFHQAEIEDIDLDKRLVVVRYREQPDFHYIPFDHLVLAVGSSTDLSGTPGVAAHSFSFKTLGDAIALRSHLISILEKADVEPDANRKNSLLTFVVAGGGYTGVEVSAEINDFVKEASQSYQHIEQTEVNVVLLQGSSRILPELDAESADFSQRVLERKGIEVRLDTRVTGATSESVTLKNGSNISTRTLVAAIGSVGNPLLEKLSCERDLRGRPVVDSNLMLVGNPNVWAVGDCVAIPNAVSDQPCPPTAQCAIRAGKHLSKNILATIANQSVKSFAYKDRGVFVPLGRFSGAARIMGFKVSGFWAWWMYRTFFLLQLPRLKRKIQVLIDWSLELVFPRDIVNLDITKSHQTTQSHYDPGQIIFSQGDLAQGFFIILDGRVEVIREKDGGSISIATLSTGDYFGEMSLLYGVRHTATIKAITAVDVVIMNANDFTMLASSSSDFRKLFSKAMTERLSGLGIENPNEISQSEHEQINDNGKS